MMESPKESAPLESAPRLDRNAPLPGAGAQSSAPPAGSQGFSTSEAIRYFTAWDDLDRRIRREKFARKFTPLQRDLLDLFLLDTVCKAARTAIYRGGITSLALQLGGADRETVRAAAEDMEKGEVVKIWGWGSKTLRVRLNVNLDKWGAYHPTGAKLPIDFALVERARGRVQRDYDDNQLLLARKVENEVVGTVDDDAVTRPLDEPMLDAALDAELRRFQTRVELTEIPPVGPAAPTGRVAEIPSVESAQQALALAGRVADLKRSDQTEDLSDLEKERAALRAEIHRRMSSTERSVRRFSEMVEEVIEDYPAEQIRGALRTFDSAAAKKAKANQSISRPGGYLLKCIMTSQPEVAAPAAGPRREKWTAPKPSPPPDAPGPMPGTPEFAAFMANLGRA